MEATRLVRGMSLHALALVIGCACGTFGKPVPESWLASADGIACDAGALRLAWKTTTLLDQSFTNGLEKWRVENYDHALVVTQKQEGADAFLSIINPAKKRDTAFSLTSPTFAVVPGLRFELCIATRGTPLLARARGHKDHYHMSVDWFSATNNPIGSQPFGLDCRLDAWRETRVSGLVHEGAAQAVVAIGADSPDILPSEPLDIRRVAFSTQARGAYRSAGEAVSRPLPLAGRKAVLRWNADVPAGTRVALQLSTAPDIGGAPGEWSPFAGPDNRTDRAFERSGATISSLPQTARWIRYCVRLSTDDASRTPTVRSVRIADAEDAAWRGVDEASPAFRALSPSVSDNARAPVRFGLSDATGLRLASLRFWADGQEATAQLRNKDGVFAFSPATDFTPIGPARDASDSPPNLHLFRVAAEDQAGNRLDHTWPLLVCSPKGNNRVAIRGDGAVLTNGVPFFPIGIYAVWKKEFNGNSFDRAFDELRTNGFNVAHSYNSGRTPEFRAFMDAAAHHGIRLFLASGQGANAKDAHTVLEDVARERAHPAVLAWYLADDTASHIAPDQLAAVSEMIHAIDPDHPTLQADGVGTPPRSNYADFVGATDGFLPELYPIREGEGVPQIITDMQTLRADIRAAGNPAKTVWPIIQYFEGWGWPRFPTADELRAMSFLALIHGANGITWYTYGGHGNNHGATHTPETWRTLCGVAREISGLQDVLLSEAADTPQMTIVAGPQKDNQSHPSVSVLAKRFHGKRVLLCANSSRADVRVSLALPGAKAATDRQEPGRTLAFAQAVLTDTFPPYGVRVYVIE